MVFTAEPTLIPTSIGGISIELSDDGVGVQRAMFSLQVVMDDGGSRVRAGNLIPHLTAQQITDLQAFMVAMRAKAVAEILPS